MVWSRLFEKMLRDVRLRVPQQSVTRSDSNLEMGSDLAMDGADDVVLVDDLYTVFLQWLLASIGDLYGDVLKRRHCRMGLIVLLLERVCCLKESAA